MTEEEEKVKERKEGKNGMRKERRKKTDYIKKGEKKGGEGE